MKNVVLRFVCLALFTFSLTTTTTMITPSHAHADEVHTTDEIGDLCKFERHKCFVDCLPESISLDDQKKASDSENRTLALRALPPKKFKPKPRVEFSCASGYGPKNINGEDASGDCFLPNKDATRGTCIVSVRHGPGLGSQEDHRFLSCVLGREDSSPMFLPATSGETPSDFYDRPRVSFACPISTMVQASAGSGDLIAQNPGDQQTTDQSCDPSTDDDCPSSENATTLEEQDNLQQQPTTIASANNLTTDEPGNPDGVFSEDV